jgi:hypothetical protein
MHSGCFGKVVDNETHAQAGADTDMDIGTDIDHATDLDFDTDADADADNPTGTHNVAGLGPDADISADIDNDTCDDYDTDTMAAHMSTEWAVLSISCLRFHARGIYTCIDI